MNFSLLRQPESPDCLPGWLYGAAGFECYTLELPLSHPEHGKIAIPEGTYRLTLEDSPHFGPDTLTINDVPGRTYIRMHAGTTERDTDGCVLVGSRLFDSNADWKPDMVLGSRVALEMLKAKVKVTLGAGEDCWINIRNSA